MWRVGVVGSPISHSLSPVLQRAALSYLGLEGTADAIDLDSADEAFSTVASSHEALSVTMPLKEKLLARCDELDDVARRIGAVNSLRCTEGVIRGRSTDGYGFLDALTEEMSLSVEGTKVVVLGSGGSAKAIIDALCGAGADVFVVARNHETGTRAVERYDNARVVLEPKVACDLVVNTIPHRDGEDRPEFAGITPSDGAVAVDIVYAPAQTPWLARRRDQGFRIQNGLPMLIHQARHQFSWWFDADVPAPILFAAVST